MAKEEFKIVETSHEGRVSFVNRKLVFAVALLGLVITLWCVFKNDIFDSYVSAFESSHSSAPVGGLEVGGRPGGRDYGITSGKICSVPGMPGVYTEIVPPEGFSVLNIPAGRYMFQMQLSENRSGKIVTAGDHQVTVFAPYAEVCFQKGKPLIIREGHPPQADGVIVSCQFKIYGSGLATVLVQPKAE